MAGMERKKFQQRENARKAESWIPFHQQQAQLSTSSPPTKERPAQQLPLSKGTLQRQDHIISPL
eukprot:1154075-Pelagomonas_calceolata.AAC.2